MSDLMDVYRLLVQDLPDESLLGTEAVLEGRTAERQRRHRRCPAQETPRTFHLTCLFGIFTPCL